MRKRGAVYKAKLISGGVKRQIYCSGCSQAVGISVSILTIFPNLNIMTIVEFCTVTDVNNIRPNIGSVSNVSSVIERM